MVFIQSEANDEINMIMLKFEIWSEIYEKPPNNTYY